MNDEIDALKHEITVLRRLLAERESNVRFLYAKIKKLAFALMGADMGVRYDSTVKEVMEFVREVVKWPTQPDDLFKF